MIMFNSHVQVWVKLPEVIYQAAKYLCFCRISRIDHDSMQLTQNSGQSHNGNIVLSSALAVFDGNLPTKWLYVSYHEYLFIPWGRSFSWYWVYCTCILPAQDFPRIATVWIFSLSFWLFWTSWSPMTRRWQARRRRFHTSGPTPSRAPEKGHANHSGILQHRPHPLQYLRNLRNFPISGMGRKPSFGVCRMHFLVTLAVPSEIFFHDRMTVDPDPISII